MKYAEGKDAGYISIDALVGILIMLIMLPIAASLWSVGVKAMKKRAVAEHFLEVEKAARLYGKRYHASLLPQVSVSSGPSVTVAQMKAADCLPKRILETNAWGQGYQITFRKNDSGGLSVVVLTTGGRGHSKKDPEFANILVPEAAAMAKAGFIPTGLVEASSVLRGAYGAWEVSLSQLGLSGSPGHLGAVSDFSSADLAQDFLYRVAVPGEPELNAMQTDLDMTTHGIRSVGELQFAPKNIVGISNFCTSPEDEGRTFLDADRGLYICRNGKTRLVQDTGNSLSMQGALIGVHNQRIDKPVCADGTNTHPEVFVMPAIASSGFNSPAVAALQAWAVDISAEQWLLQMRILTAKNEWVYPGSDYGRMVVMTSCARD